MNEYRVWYTTFDFDSPTPINKQEVVMADDYFMEDGAYVTFTEEEQAVLTISGVTRVELLHTEIA